MALLPFGFWLNIDLLINLSRVAERSRRMKIAILSFYSGHIDRGVETWTHQMASRLSKNADVTIFQNGPKVGKTNYKVISTGLKVDWNNKDTRGTLRRRFFIDYWSRLVTKSTFRVIPEFYRKRFDVIIPTNGGWQSAISRIFTWIFGGKLVIVGHSGKGWDERIGVYNFPNVFVGLSIGAKKWAKKINLFIRTAYIPNGIDLELFSVQGTKEKVNLQRPIFLCVSAPEKGKRLELAIQAVSKLRTGSLLVLGEGYEERRIKNLGHKLLGERFLMKQVPFSKIPNYYRSADVFTLPSWKHEAFGMVYLEAMASNLPVVATDDELRREVVGSAGILIDPVNLDSYARALRKALNTKWGNKPRIQAEKFSWEKVVKKYENLFEELVQEKKCV